MKIILMLAALASSLLLGSPAFADSLPLKDGRYNGGPVVVVDLDSSQRNYVQEHYSPYMELVLGSRQREQIANSKQLKDSPTKLIIVTPSDTEGDCICGIANIGLIIGESALEIPLRYVMTDEEAQALKIVD